MNAAARYRPALGVHTRRFDGELVIVDLERGDYFGLDEIGAEVWEGVARGDSLDEIVRRLETVYEASPKELETDAGALLRVLVDRGLLVVDAPTSASPAR